MLRLIAVGLLIVGLALGLLTGWGVPLGETLFRYDPALLNTAQAGIQRYASPALWDDGVLPLLERPSWVLPAGSGALLLMLRGLLLSPRRR
ncbi:MAG: hypothetical protein AVDCRST_MAG08-875 [uncultured Acetobacteraceae bacterium]|uniref:Uncharacterized protein n=1 Tax=uncultured Acetobacteraceae bacterium TaxID=169975 RepID=A0A6J4HHS5_9PROT|nr:MAG: hypothetical protein AVDCRST_MAG08-875 [uncultured Acetobacteraceae bacterium]